MKKIKEIIRIIKIYGAGNNHLIPLETRLSYYLFGVNWYYEDSFYYKVIAKPIVATFRFPTMLIVYSILRFFNMKCYYKPFGNRYNKYCLIKD